jgi:hypothetical protein
VANLAEPVGSADDVARPSATGLLGRSNPSNTLPSAAGERHSEIVLGLFKERG